MGHGQNTRQSCPLKPCGCLCRLSVPGLQINMATVKDKMLSAWGDSSSHAEAPWERLGGGHGDSGAAPLMPFTLHQSFPSLDPRLVIPPTGRLRAPMWGFRINWLHQAERSILNVGSTRTGNCSLGQHPPGFSQPLTNPAPFVPRDETNGSLSAEWPRSDPIAPTDSPASRCTLFLDHTLWPLARLPCSNIHVLTQHLPTDMVYWRL